MEAVIGFLLIMFVIWAIGRHSLEEEYKRDYETWRKTGHWPRGMHGMRKGYGGAAQRLNPKYRKPKEPIKTEPKPYCPKCASVMVLRRPKANQNWAAFWGCPNYPNCDGTRRILENGEPENGDRSWYD
jgi:hypothetical protein